MLKHGPNYSEQIKETNESLAALAATQERMSQQYTTAFESEKEHREKQERHADAARWKPTAQIESKVEGDKQVSKLILKSPQSFFLNEVSLVAPGGAKLFDYPVLGGKVASTGFSIPISHESLNKVAEISPSFFQHETFSGSFRYSVEREGKDPTSFTGEIPFHGERVYVANTCFFKLNG